MARNSVGAPPRDNGWTVLFACARVDPETGICFGSMNTLLEMLWCGN